MTSARSSRPVPDDSTTSQAATPATGGQPDPTIKSDDAMVGVIVGGILTLAFVVLLMAMLLVNLWTFNNVAPS